MYIYIYIIVQEWFNIYAFRNNQIYPLQINTVIENKLGNLNLTKYQIFPEFFVLYIMTDTLFIPEHALLAFSF
jgi:hypothetical protein